MPIPISSCVGANDKLRCGVFGVNGMGFADLSAFLRQKNTECVAICDVDSNVLNKRAADTEKIQGKKPKLYSDYRKILEDKEVDVVIIGTPDHWHCLPMVEACQAGKDVYCEKPLGNSIEEINIGNPLQDLYRVSNFNVVRNDQTYFKSSFLILFFDFFTWSFICPKL